MIRFRCEEGADEHIDIAIHDGLDIARLDVRAVVLDHRVRLEDVGANLATPLDLLLVALELRELSFLLLHLELKELRAQHLEALLAILELGALILALHDDARRLVRHADGRRRFVDVLAASARRAVRVDADIRHVDVDLDIVIDLRHDVAGRERRVAARLRVKRRDAHKAMDSLLRLEEAVGIMALDESDTSEDQNHQ